MSVSTILGSDTVRDALKTKVNANDSNLDTRVSALEGEVEDARGSDVDVNTRIVEIETDIASIAAGSGVIVSVDDATVGVLDGKLLAGEAIDFAVDNDGGDETLTISCEDATTSNKGVASFAASDFSISSGAVSARKTVTAKTADYTLTAADLTGSTILTNTGASGEINFTWPTIVAGQDCEFEVTAAQYLKVTAPTGVVFTYNGSDSAAAGYIRSNTAGTEFRVRCNGTKLTIVGLTGVVSYDE